MATKTKFQAIKGTRDLLPPETALWNRVEKTAHEVFATFGFGEIRVPTFELTELFARAVGGDTDIVSKEMYSFFDNPDISELEEAQDVVRELGPTVSPQGGQEAFLFYLSQFISKVEQRLAA